MPRAAAPPLGSRSARPADPALRSNSPRVNLGRATRPTAGVGGAGPDRARPDREIQAAHAHDPAAGPQGPPGQGREDQDPGAQGEPAAPRRLHARLHDHAEEAELGAAQGRPRPADQPDRGHRLHPGRRPQPAGALDRARPRRPGEGPARASATRSSAARWTPRASGTASRLAAGTARRRRRANAAQGPRPEAPGRHRPGLRLAAGHPAGQQGAAGRQAVRRRADRLRRPRGLPREDRQRPGRHAQARAGQREAGHRGQEPPRRWRDLPGAGRGPRRPRRPRSRCAGWSSTAAPAARRR